MDEDTDINELLQTALNNENNSNIMELTNAKISQWKNDALQRLFLERKELKSFHKKLKEYKYVSDMSDLSFGHYIRWINLKNPDNFKLTNGAIVCDIKVINNQVQIICKGGNRRIFQIKFDETMIFQKLTDQEKVLLSVLDYLNK
jgi:hypothetical protein|uniref:Uncharacterized protein n=1 Tax=viral metagenome TaxID=1070528 RepID=A0A6C0C0Q1_9ZZZZ